jgi:hypothetical protein
MEPIVAQTISLPEVAVCEPVHIAENKSSLGFIMACGHHEVFHAPQASTGHARRENRPQPDSENNP